jgi:cytochrome c553
MIRRKHITWVILALSGLFSPCAISSLDEINQALDLEPDINKGRKIYSLCATCHLENGMGKINGSFPVIAGQHRKVLIKQLADIRARNRHNPTMYPFSDPATIGGAQSIADVTAYIASLRADSTQGKGSGQQLDSGKKIYQQHCQQCHGGKGEGNNEAFFPKLRGQHYAYLLRQLKWIKDGYRKNSNPVMMDKLKNMTEIELDAVADYLSHLH